MNWLYFLAGMSFGACLGVFLMACFAINPRDLDEGDLCDYRKNPHRS